MSRRQDPERPVAVEGIEVVPTADGYVVYHEQRDRVHYLNHTAVLVLELCTGENSVEEIVQALQLAYELPEPPEAETAECLTRLRAEGLVA
jgi:hypothetical protein